MDDLEGDVIIHKKNMSNNERVASSPEEREIILKVQLFWMVFRRRKCKCNCGGREGGKHCRLGGGV